MNKVLCTSTVTEELILLGCKENVIERDIREILKYEIFSRQRMKLTTKNKKEGFVALFLYRKILGIQL